MQEIRKHEALQPRLFSASEYYRMVADHLLDRTEHFDPLRGQITQSASGDPHSWTVGEYYRLGELGILHPEERLELIDGQILPVSPQGPLHAESVEHLAKVLAAALAGEALLRNEKPVVLGQFAEPVPDLAVVENRSYRHRHPGPENILLIIEVADSSLEYDLGTKRAMYAQAGIQEYWVVNLRQRRLHRFSHPGGNRYLEETILNASDTVTSAAFLGMTFVVEALLLPPE
ncbi:Uma2 family endonuclease [Gloeobacter violaceus]|uniref:Glr1208 protein n=1 Tax=Gloeobacter violaceus (strain ATCC 29082 / PCC 7421) TaxID=251221 RepID=Q7NLB8_GLOVI|nr:Uma2 family endonuclease [Gloeobacter violaceus]BAC89149.1 glr1208 [Gloeobacter violaceus PCC 7421]